MLHPPASVAAPAAPAPPGWRPSPAARAAALAVLAQGHLSDADRTATDALRTAVAALLGLPAERLEAFASATGALAAALLAAGARPRRRVLLPALLPPYVAGVVRLLGATPVAVDVDPATLALHPVATRAAGGSAVVAIVDALPLGQGGVARSLAEADLPGVVEDSAQLLGERDDLGRPLGVRAFAGVFSFAYGKALGVGEGGLLALAGADAPSRFEALLGRQPPTLPRLGAFGRLPLVTAALALASVPELTARAERRRRLTARLGALAVRAGVTNLRTGGLPLWAGRFPTAAAARQATNRGQALRLELAPPPHFGPLAGLPVSRDSVERVRLLPWWDAGAARPAELETLIRAFAGALGVEA